MSTVKQKKLAQVVLENPDFYQKGSKAELVEMGGYGHSVQKTPSKALESKGFKEELAKLGLTEEFITTALVEDIREKPKNRLGELRLGAEILKMNDDKLGGDKNLVIIISGESAKRYNVDATS